MADSQTVLNETKEKMQKAQEVLERELGKIRAGQANASLLNGVMVDYYGAPTPLNQISSISIPEARVILVTPYDKSALDNIEKGIYEADLGLNPANDGTAIRLAIPALTEDRRKEIAKQVKATGEKSKVAVRNVRREAMDTLKRSNKKEEITDDDFHRLEDQVQKLTDNSIKSVDKIVADKENEVVHG
ncbi:MAG: ribosome recycling factor [Lentilactobacillus diolivorans]|jgi:ribosome recycling factor|uniref:Ribosome-recycling factor n=2 Tax=Lentilactobacillus diolivorans TaxID=179838 RepID=A0A0R1SUH7_9LACO|nr:ribosome recycling factor [Lentilactobacillus diolivorans]RRG04568.1 MAG: ribosome recycling factor [Lactobacillus sp.]KRL68923.1 ribosome recycling factor [Lentilactobacillus diolivorans DSM 14421]MCH4164839.1 ribosome recycling factor [Lentilactobacillus diolivorans]MDH5104437.1 ribosome recycling factor [Lentilactobacillus diolivorans]GEP22632.1 ribosome-recycling factor [Lentilactobacillus diolivorans]